MRIRMYEFLIQSELLHSVITSTNLRHGVGEAEEEEGRRILEVVKVHTTDALHNFVVICRFWCIGRVLLIAERVAVLLGQENLKNSCRRNVRLEPFRNLKVRTYNHEYMNSPLACLFTR